MDEVIDINEETEEEIYPDFAQNHDLQWYFSGQVVWDIIDNTKHQLINPTVADYLRNFNHYNEHDCFFDYNHDFDEKAE